MAYYLKRNKRKSTYINSISNTWTNTLYDIPKVVIETHHTFLNWVLSIQTIIMSLWIITIEEESFIGLPNLNDLYYPSTKQINQI